MAGAAALVGVAAPFGATAAHAAPLNYVALGDSYTAGPFILPVVPTAPPECLRSERNYPHLVAAARGYALTDVSCSGAKTSDMTSSQYPNQPPQFNALSASTGVVSVGIGGNDNNLFISTLEDCFRTDALDFTNTGAPCKAAYGNTFANEAAADEPVLARAFTRIHQLAPNAKVFVMGYPDILPQQGNCYPQVPLTTGDTAYLNHVELVLNQSESQAAAQAGATYVDTYTPSIGHDACKPEGVRWVEPPVPSTDAFPVHPNAAGEAADAADLQAAMAAAGLG